MTELAVGLIGPGLVGKALLHQLQLQAAKLRTPHGVILKVCGIANSRKMILAQPSTDRGLDLSTWQDQLSEGESSKLEIFLERLAQHKHHSVLVDCTASQHLPDAYSRWIAQPHCSVVTPNKQLGAGPQSRYDSVTEACRQSGNQFFYEGLLNTGDSVKVIEGIFSGTLSYIFNTFGPGRSFSEVVSQAKAAGYTEPDPREDLSGMDVARKVVILARECGLQLDLQDVDVESLVPAPLRNSPTAEAFLDGLPEFDEAWQQKASEAADQGEKLCYVGQIDVENRRCRVGLQAYPSNHAFAQLQGADNIISFTTERYSQQPLFVRGPGAGAEVTATGVFSDLLLLAKSLGARF